MSAALPLRDVHLPEAPSLWPPAPGWWLVAAVLLVLALIPLWRSWQRRRRRRAWVHVFQQELAGVADDLARLTLLNALLRRALREAQPDAAQLRGEAWLQVIDPKQELDRSQRAALDDGAYRPQIDARLVQSLLPWAQRRFASLLQERQP